MINCHKWSKNNPSVPFYLPLWRDQLLQGDQTLLEELANRFENFERQRVSQLIRNVKKEQELNKPPKSARLLFKYLTELQRNG